MTDLFPKYSNQISQDEHDNSSGPASKRVMPYGWNPTSLTKERLKSLDGSQFTSAPSYTYKFDNNGNGDPIYIGVAAIGSLTSDPKWQIRKLVYSGSDITDIQWPATNDFVNVWTNRASLTYS